MSATRDWDAETYDRVSSPQVRFAEAVLDRLAAAGDETVLDAGCGSGRVTRMLLERLPRGRVVAVDGSPAMLAKARESLPADRVTIVQADLTEMELDEPVDAAFSNAVFHWVADHDRLFARIHAALRPGARLVAQCGGEGNVERFHWAAREVAGEDPFAGHLGRWDPPWNFASAEATAERLRGAGFTDVETWLERTPVRPEDPFEYLAAVCLGHQLEGLPDPLRDDFVGRVLERTGRPLELDYVRLNIDARRPE